MKLIRLKADYTENKKEFIILLLLVDQDDKIITNYEMFGHLTDDDGEDNLHTYPFIIHATNKSDLMTFKYGADSAYTMDKTNLPQKKLRIGEYFTRWVDDTDEYTYIISNIEKII